MSKIMKLKKTGIKYKTIRDMPRGAIGLMHNGELIKCIDLDKEKEDDIYYLFNYKEELLYELYKTKWYQPLIRREIRIHLEEVRKECRKNKQYKRIF